MLGRNLPNKDFQWKSQTSIVSTPMEMVFGTHFDSPSPSFPSLSSFSSLSSPISPFSPFFLTRTDAWMKSEAMQIRFSAPVYFAPKCLILSESKTPIQNKAYSGLKFVQIQVLEKVSTGANLFISCTVVVENASGGLDLNSLVRIPAFVLTDER